MEEFYCIEKSCDEKKNKHYLKTNTPLSKNKGKKENIKHYKNSFEEMEAGLLFDKHIQNSLKSFSNIWVSYSFHKSLIKEFFFKVGTRCT